MREPEYAGLSLTSWVKISIVAILMLWLFYTPCLARLWLKINPFTGEPNWGHSAFIPIVGLYYIYLNREELLRIPVVPLHGAGLSRMRFVGGGITVLIGLAAYFLMPLMMSDRLVEYVTGLSAALAVFGFLAILADWGIGTILFGLLVFAYGIHPGQNDFYKDVGMIITLFGVVLALCGWEMMKILWFPIVFLFCGLPWPALIYSAVAGPLQHLAASVAVGVLNVFAADSVQRGTKIFIQREFPMPPRVLNVAEACAGMRSLMTFISVAATVAFLSGRPLWQKIIITISAVPIAIFCNVMRVAGQGLLDHYVSQQLSESFAHQFVGLVMLVPAFFLILLVGWMLDQVFIEEMEDSKPTTIKVVKHVPPHDPATAPRRPGLGSTPVEEG